MKKKLLLLTLVLTVLVMSLSSCSFLEKLGINLDFLNPSSEEAKKIFQEAEEEMEKLTSYETRGTLDFSFFYGDVEFSFQMSTTLILIDDASQGYYHYNKAVTVFRAPGLGLNETYVSLDAYHDGHYFLLRQEGNNPYQKITTPMTREEAIAFQTGTSSFEVDDLNFSNCSSKSATLNEDGSYTLRFSNYADSVLDAYWEAMGLKTYEHMISEELLDLNLTILVNRDRRIEQMRVSFVFEEAENIDKAPSFTYTVNTLAFNSATRKTDELILADYTEEPNLKTIYDLDRLWNDRAEASEGSFLLTLEEAVYLDGQKTTSKGETDDVVFGVDAYGYCFAISYVETDGTRTKLKYSNEIIEITRDGEVNYRSQTDKDAKDFVTGLILFEPAYDPNSVTSIEVKENGVYKVTVKSATEESMQSILTSMGAKYQSTEHTFTFTVSNGSLVKVQGVVVGTGTLDGSVVTYIASGDLAFR